MSAASSSRFSRRAFLANTGRGLAACALHQLAPRFAGAADGGATEVRADEPRALVIVQLEGGNDGWNTVVPLRDERYRALRPTLALAARDVVPLGETVALHPAARSLEPLFKNGKLAIIQNVGFAPPSASHFRATEIWHTGSAPDETLYSGWAGRCISHLRAQGRDARALHATTSMPRIFFRDEATGNDATPSCVPLACAGSDVRETLAEIAERAARSNATEIYFVGVPGFDTHFDQAEKHAGRLRALSDALHAFQLRLAQRGVERRVLTMVFSEFGRTLAENAQGGTDHGGGAPAFVLGATVRGGLLNDDFTEAMDFRRIVGTIATRWLGVSATAVLGGDFPAISFLPPGVA